MSFLVSILVFGIVIMIHELGHFVVAKKSGIKVNEFSIGMGPRLAGVKKGETEYGLTILASNFKQLPKIFLKVDNVDN